MLLASWLFYDEKFSYNFPGIETSLLILRRLFQMLLKKVILLTIRIDTFCLCYKNCLLLKGCVFRGPFLFFWKMTPLGVKFNEKSIARIAKAWKCHFQLIFAKISIFLLKKSEKISIFAKIIWRSHFHASAMRAIDF